MEYFPQVKVEVRCIGILLQGNSFPPIGELCVEGNMAQSRRYLVPFPSKLDHLLLPSSPHLHCCAVQITAVTSHLVQLNLSYPHNPPPLPLAVILDLVAILDLAAILDSGYPLDLI